MGTFSLAAPLVLFEKSRLWAGTWFHFLPSFHHHPTQHNYTTQTVTLTVTLTSTFSRTINRYSSHSNVVCPSGAWFENRPHLTPSIHLAWNLKHLIVQWVGIGTHTPFLLRVRYKEQRSENMAPSTSHSGLRTLENSRILYHSVLLCYETLSKH